MKTIYTLYNITIFNKLSCTCQVPSPFIFLETSEYLENPFSRKGHFIAKKNSLENCWPIVTRQSADNRLRF